MLFRFFSLLLLIALLLTGCRGHEKASTPPLKESSHRAIYHCAMHPQIIKDGPGDCPICGMALVPIETAILEPGTAQGNGGYPVIQVDGSTARRIDIRVTSVFHRYSARDTLTPVWVIPARSLIRTEGRSRVIAYLGEGRYQARDVEIGRETREWIEILQGLEEGDKIVVSGQFLLMSESELQASAHQLNQTNGNAGDSHE